MESEKEKEETKKQQEQNKDLFGAIKEALGERVTEVRLSGRLKNAACCLTAKDVYKRQFLFCRPAGRAFSLFCSARTGKPLIQTKEREIPLFHHPSYTVVIVPLSRPPCNPFFLFLSAFREKQHFFLISVYFFGEKMCIRDRPLYLFFLQPLLLCIDRS